METKTLAEIGTVVTGKTPSTSRRDYYGGDVPFITPTELHAGRTVGQSAKTLSEAGLQSIKGSILEGTSVLVGCIGWDMGNVAMTNDRCASNQQINAVTSIISEVNPSYLYYWLSTKKDYLFSIASVTRTPILSKSTFEQVKVPVPSRDVQDGIARILSSIDDKIATNDQVNDNLQAMLQTLYGYWFLQFDFPDENGRPYRSSGGRMVWNDQLKREIPAGWRAVTLRELLKKNRKAFDYGTVEPTIDLSVMPTGSIALNNLSRSDAFSSNLYQMSEGDILFGAIRPYLKKAGIAPCNGVVAGTVHSFSPVRVDDYNFALATITSEQMFSHAVRSSTGTRMPTVKADDLLDVVVAYSESVATAFNQIPVARSIIERVQESSRLGELRNWLLPLLMNGQATVASSDKLSFT